mgnify:CR=1 FL=1
MLKRFVIFIFIVGLVYLNYTTPKIEDHKAFLLSQLEQSYPVPEEMQERIWKEVDYSNFLVCSFMKTSVGSTMVSYGLLRQVRLVDTEWTDKVKTRLQQQAERY